MNYNEVTIQRILNPTSINLGEYVINPYMGCEYGCLYCYVRSNKVVFRKKEPWGTYVDIRANAPELLEKELRIKQPKTVLLGSTTECFQPIENGACISKEVLEILNKHGVSYVILTRSPAITRYLHILSRGCCKRIYFTVNTMPEDLKKQLEPKSPAFETRTEAIHTLLKHNIPVTPYFSPVLPWISRPGEVFSLFPEAQAIDFEGLNLRLVNIATIIDRICSLFPELKKRYQQLLEDNNFYHSYWQSVKKEIIQGAIKAKKNYTIYIHGFRKYFENKYAG